MNLLVKSSPVCAIMWARGIGGFDGRDWVHETKLSNSIACWVDIKVDVRKVGLKPHSVGDVVGILCGGGVVIAPKKVP